MGDIEDSRALPRLRAMFADGSAWVRSEAVIALARYGTKDDSESVLGLLDDTEPRVRAAAVAALYALHPTAGPQRTAP